MVPRALLEQLAVAIARGRMECPLEELGLLDAGYAFDRAEILAPLHTAMERGGRATVQWVTWAGLGRCSPMAVHSVGVRRILRTVQSA